MAGTGTIDRKAQATGAVDALTPELVALSHEIHAHPELGYEERIASGLLADALAGGGFEVERAAFGIETSLMTSGSNGYHLRARLEPKTDAETVARLARGTAALAAEAHPDEMTLAFRKADRGDRVFVDWLRNAPYSTSVVPWSLRARPGAPGPRRPGSSSTMPPSPPGTCRGWSPSAS